MRAKNTPKQGYPERLQCFVLMPISEPDGYEDGHFRRVLKSVFEPACEKAGYQAIRSDEVAQTDLIQLDILQKLIETPMALCDLTTRNPNVLFELGLRQAFDKPVVLVREVGTPPIFDIAPLRYTEYRASLIYEEVLEDQEKIARSLIATRDAASKGQTVNSLVRLLALTQPATMIDLQKADTDPILQIIRAELSELRAELGVALGLRTQPTSSTVPQNIIMAKDSVSYDPPYRMTQDMAERFIKSAYQSNLPEEWIRHISILSGIPWAWLDKKIAELGTTASEEVDHGTRTS